MDGSPVPAAPPSRLRRLLPWLATVVVFGLAVVLVGWLGASKERELDLRTGRTRTVRYVAWLPVSQRVEATALSRELSAEDLRLAEPRWRALPGAETEIGTLAVTWKCGRFAPEARRLMAKDVLALWEESGAVAGSRPFTQKIEDLIDSAAGREITAKDVLEAWRAAGAGRGQ
jgi:hypothetical protein